MKVTAYVDVLSHWCLAAAPALEALSATLANDVSLEVVIAPLADGGPVGFDARLERWYYRRGTLAYGAELSAAWYESAEASTWAANQAVAAAIELGADPVRTVRLASRAAMKSGELLGRPDEAARVVARITSLSESSLRERMEAPGFAERLRSGNNRLAAIGCGERPSWHFQSENGDFGVLQGVWQAEAILAVVTALLADERAYRRAGPPPSFA